MIFVRMWTSKITSGWRITIPVEVRKILNLKASNKIRWIQTGSRMFTIERVRQIEEL